MQSPHAHGTNGPLSLLTRETKQNNKLSLQYKLASMLQQRLYEVPHGASEMV